MNMPFFNSTTIPIFIAAIALIAGILALFQYLPRIIRWLNRFEAFGLVVKGHKDEWLNQWIGGIPMTANTMSVLRPMAVVVALSQFYDHRTLGAILAFTTGWILDLLDGPKARHEARIRGRPSAYGHILDPAMDILCFLMMVVVLRRYFPPLLMWVFGGAIAARALYGGLLLIRYRWWPNLRLTMMPESIAGKFKTLFAAIAFGLIIIWPNSGVARHWAARTLVFATVLELISLMQQTFRAIRPKHVVAAEPANNIIPLRRTGNE